MLEREEYILKRRAKGITLSEIAKAIKCSQSLLSQYERGKANMSMQKFKKYKEYIDNYKGK